MARIAEMPCLVCGGQATVHHVTASIHGGFYRTYGIDLEAEAKRLAGVQYG